MSGEGGFLDRWSRRKQEARREEARDQARDAEAREEREGEKEKEPAVLDEKTLAERLAELPRLDDIGELTDIRPFMEPWVPESVRGPALRKLWTVDRAVREHEIFADYALDYNTPGAAPGYGSIVTTADMAARALASFSRDPNVRPDEEEAGGSDTAPVAERDSTPPVLEAVRRDEVRPSDDRTAPASAHESSSAEPIEAPVENSAATREASVSNKPFPRRHGSATPR